jgi:hypothetical protein
MLLLSGTRPLIYTEWFTLAPAAQTEVAKANANANASAEAEGEESAWAQALEAVKAVAYALTDMEAFQPRPRKITVLSRVYRLLAVRSTTPQDLFARKVRRNGRANHSHPSSSSAYSCPAGAQAFLIDYD